MRLQNEVIRRQHCEKQIHELNESLLELQQQLAVANDLVNKREAYAQTIDSALQKVTKAWRQKEAEIESTISKLKLEKQALGKAKAKLTMRNQLLEEELKKLGSDLISEKIKCQESVNELSQLRAKLNAAEKANDEQRAVVQEASSEIDKLKLSEKALSDEVSLLKDCNENVGRVLVP